MEGADAGTGPERRRSPRGWTKLWVAVDGIDNELRPRNGNVSATGVYFEYDKRVGDSGTVQWLYLSSADRIVSLQIMACVVRTVALSNLDGKPMYGVALEFMPESDEAVAQLRDFLHYVLALAADGVRAHDVRAAARESGMRSVVLESELDLPVGSPVRVEVIARGVARTMRVEGRVVKNMRHIAPPSRMSVSEQAASPPPLYKIEIAVQRELEGPMRRFSASTMQAVTGPAVKERVDGSARRFTPSHGIPFAKDTLIEADRRENEQYISEALEGLLGTLLDIRSQPRSEVRAHLSGELERIKLPTLLSVFEMERMTGELEIEHVPKPGMKAMTHTLYVREGRIVDLAPPPTASARETLREILSWEQGRFSFTMTAVERADVVATPTMALLLDFARESDEARRDLTNP